MHRIDSAGNVLSRFSEGNPQTGQRATVVSAAWLNDIQENIAYCIEQVGEALVKGDETQLYQAIVAVIAASGGGGGGGTAVDITRQVLGGGLVTGGGALATDITLSVAKATSAEILAGIVDNKAITPAGLAAAVTKSLGLTGYVKRADGMIEMWGAATALGNSTTVITLPSTFPNACLYAGVEGGGGGGNVQDNSPYVSGRGLSTISVFSDRDNSVAVNYFALGY